MGDHHPQSLWRDLEELLDLYPLDEISGPTAQSYSLLIPVPRPWV